MSVRLSDVPENLIDPTKKPEFLEFVKWLPVSEELKVSIIFQWAVATKTPISGMELKLTVGMEKPEDAPPK